MENAKIDVVLTAKDVLYNGVTGLFPLFGVVASYEYAFPNMEVNSTIVCAGNENSPVIMCHFLRPTENGCELRTRFWMGYCVKDNKVKRTLVPPVKLIPETVIKKLLEHNIMEFTNLRAFLPEVYEEFKDDLK